MLWCPTKWRSTVKILASSANKSDSTKSSFLRVLNVIDHILEDISTKLMQKQQKELKELMNFNESKIDGGKKIAEKKT